MEGDALGEGVRSSRGSLKGLLYRLVSIGGRGGGAGEVLAEREGELVAEYAGRGL